MKMRKATPFVVVGLLGLACSSSGLKTIAHDGGVATGGQAGSTMSRLATGGIGGTTGSGGAGAASSGGAAGAAGTISSGGIYGADAGVDGVAGVPDAGNTSDGGGYPCGNIFCLAEQVCVYYTCCAAVCPSPPSPPFCVDVNAGVGILCSGADGTIPTFIGGAVPSGTPPFNSHVCYSVCA
jgi:hypothetical protein